jgi:6-phosphogluconate dehydrogenase
MEVGIVGLGKMGAGIARRLARGDHRVIGFDSDPAARAAFTDQGFITADSLAGLVGDLQAPPVVWMMVPAGPAVDQTVGALARHLPTGSTLIDGGNSNYSDTLRRHEDLEARGVHLIDVGTSGGVRGEASGYCLMIGGDPEAVEPLEDLFRTLAPAADRGWGHVGPPGAGHFAKMIHNGIEYGMMEAIAEGFAMLEKRHDFRFDLAGIAAIWNEGSVIRSWLLELTGAVFERNPGLEGIRSAVDDSGEGRWAVAEAIDLDVAAPVLSLALMARIQSRDTDAFGSRVLSALRHEFGGHAAGLEITDPDSGDD